MAQTQLLWHSGGIKKEKERMDEDTSNICTNAAFWCISGVMIQKQSS